MKKLIVTLDLIDDFMPGDCESCPLSFLDYYDDEDDGLEVYTCCVLQEDGACNCPLKETRRNEYQNIPEKAGRN